MIVWFTENLTSIVWFVTLLSASGSRKMPDGRQQEPGGWNRIVLQVDDLPSRIER